MAADRTADDQGLALYKAAQAGKVTAVARLLDSGAPIEWQVKNWVRGRGPAGPLCRAGGAKQVSRPTVQAM